MPRIPAVNTTRRSILLGAAATPLCGSGCRSLAIEAHAPPVEGPAAAAPQAAPPPDWGDARIAADFEPLAAVWIGWDAGHEAMTAAMVAALEPVVPLTLLVTDATAADAARAALRRRGLRADALRVVIEPLAMVFVRDAAVFTRGPGGGLGVIDLRWSQYGLPGWCARRHAGDAAQVKDCSAGVETVRDGLEAAIARATGAPLFRSALALEGGAVESNGQGLLIANEALCLQRNPGLDRAALETEMLRLPGVRRVIWLPAGLAQDPLHRATITGDHVGWGTGGHTDEFVRFADPHTVLLAWPDEAEARRHPVTQLNQQRLQRCFEILQRAVAADGRPLRVVKLPLPRIIERRVFLSAVADGAWSQQWSAAWFPAAERRREGDAVMQVASASYLNFVLANGVVLVPDYLPHGTTKALQARVRQVFEAVFPDRQLHFIDAIVANWVGGGMHCATLSQPMTAGAAPPRVGG